MTRMSGRRSPPSPGGRGRAAGGGSGGGATAAGWRRQPGARHRPGRRQQHREDRAAARLAAHHHLAVEVGDDAVDDGQPQAEPLADGARGEEGIEDPRQHVGRDAGPGVGDLDADPAVGVQRGGGLDQVPLRLAGGDGLGRVHQQVEEDLADAVGVAQHRRHRPQLHGELGALADLALGQRDRALQRPPHVHLGPLGVAGAGEGAQVADDLPDAGGAAARVLERLADLAEVLRQVVEPGEHVVHVGEHVGQRVVDLVGHAGRERGHRGHPVGQLQLQLQPPPLGDVADDGLAVDARPRSRRRGPRPPPGRWSRPCAAAGSRRGRPRTRRAPASAGRGPPAWTDRAGRRW